MSEPSVKEGYKQAEVGILPKGWSRELLGSLAKRGSGHTPSKKFPHYWNGSIKWISLQDSARLDKIYISETAATISESGLANSSAVLHPKGTVVLSRDASVGKSAIMSEAMAVSQHFMAWQCGPKLNNHFLYYFLQYKKSEFERIAIGNTIKTIGLAYFKAYKILVPPGTEQGAIATALFEVDALISGLDQLIAKKRDLKQAAMHQLLTGQRRLPNFSRAWEVKRLGDLAMVNMGQSPSSRNYNKSGQGLPLIQGNADIERRKTTRRVWTTQITKLCEEGDLILTVRAPVGEVAVASERSCLGRGVCSLRPVGVNSRFLFHALVLAEKNWKILEQGSTFTSANSAQIASFSLPIAPSIEEQIAIANVLSEMDAELAALEARRNKVLALKQGMMHELLTGRRRLMAHEGDRDA